jgi:general secretion pathway protein B
MDLSSNGNVLMLEDLTAYQTALLPDLIYQMHIFSSDVSERWVKINDKILYEGNELVPGLTLLEIKQNLIIWRFNNRKVGQLALVDFVQ